MKSLSTHNILLSVVVPLFCEEPNLDKVIAKLRKVLDTLDCEFEIILVDDGSTDNTWEEIRDFYKNYKFIKAIRFSRNFGKEAAISAGIEFAAGNAVITIDGDLEHPPSLIIEMFKLWRNENVEIIEAVKDSRGKESLIKRMGAKSFYAIFDKLSGYELSNATDFKLLDRKVVDAWLNMGERNLFFRGMIPWLGFKQKQIPFGVSERVGGTSKWSIIKLFRLAITALSAFSSLPLHMVTIVGIIFFLFAIILGLNTILQKILGIAVGGFTTVILLQLIIGSVIMICLGIIGEYIARIYHEVKQRPRYIIKEKIGYNKAS